MPVTNENVIAQAVLIVAAGRKDGVASFRRIRKELPKLVPLSNDDLAPSTTRNGEPMWHQIVRNIKSHFEAEGNYIEQGLLVHVPRVGYRITQAGKKTIN